MRQYEGTVQSDQGAIDSAKLQLTYSRVTAPIGGRVGLRQVDPGNVVHASDANGIVVITQLQPITVVFPIPEDNVPRVHDAGCATGEADRRRGVGPRPEGEARDRQAPHGRQPDRHDHRHGQAEGGVRATTNLALFPNQFVNVRMLVADADRRDARSVGRDPARRARHVRLRRQGRPDRHRRAGEARARAGRDHGDRERRRARRRWSSSTAPTSCAKARRSSSSRATRRPRRPPGAKARPRGDRPPGSGPPARRQRQGAAQGRQLSVAPLARGASTPMNPSRLFILRPVATTLLMVAILLAGHRRLPRAAALGAARGRLSDDPGRDALSRARART